MKHKFRHPEIQFHHELQFDENNEFFVRVTALDRKCKQSGSKVKYGIKGTAICFKVLLSS